MTLAVLYGAGFLLVRLAGRLRGAVGVAWRYGVANLARRGRESVVQVVAFGLGLMVLLLLAVVRGDLLKDWRASLPADTPNFFMINIPAAETGRVRALRGGPRPAGAEALPDDPRAHDGHQRPADRGDRAGDGPRRGLRRARAEPVLGRASAAGQPHRGGPLVERGRPRQALRLGRDRVPGGARAQARRPPRLRRRGRDGGGARS